MLHILLIILKIIGIILAVLLGLLLIILLLILFVPIRYKGKLYKEKELEVTARITWLLHIISVPIVFQDGILTAKINLLGITIKKLMGDEEELEENTDELFRDMEDMVEEGLEEIKEQDGSIPDISDEEMNSPEAWQKEENGDTVQERGTEEVKETIDEGEFDQEDKEFTELEISEQEKSGPIKRIFAKIKAFFLKMIGIWKKIKNIKYTFRRFCGKIKKGIRKYRDTKEFLLDERTKRALQKSLEQAMVLIKKLLPKKLRGELRFGTEDPALTGEILGGISIFYPIFKDNVKVYPDFERSILEGELFVKGRICLVTVALVLWRLWRDKNIRYVYYKFHRGE